MEETDVHETNGTGDLLSLIGSSIEQLQQCIQLFEKDDAAAGVQHLNAVIHGISTYLAQLEGDPIVQLAGVDPANLTESLHHVQSDLSSVVQQVGQSPSG